MPSWTLWLFLAVLLVLPVVAAFAEDRPPSNEITHEQDGARRDEDGDTAEIAAAA